VKNGQLAAFFLSGFALVGACSSRTGSARDAALDTSSDVAVSQPEAAEGRTSGDGSAHDESGFDATDVTIDAGMDAEAASADAPAAEASPDGDGVAFDVRSLPGLVLWLDASTGIRSQNHNVVGWSDGSGAGDDALPSGYGQFSVLASVASDAAAGHDAVRLDINQVYAVASPAGTAALGFGTGDFLVEVVASWGDTGRATVFATLASPTVNLFELFWDEAGHLGVALSGGPPAVTSAMGISGDGAFHLVAARRTGGGAGTKLEVRMGGAALDAATGAADAADLHALASGRIGPGRLMEIAEVVVVKGTTSDADLAKLEAYLLHKYGLQAP